MSSRSALYVGSVMHNRVRPRAHRLRYSVFWMLLDLDDIDDLARRYRLFSHNRFNALSFRDSDHGDGSATPIAQQIRKHLDEAGIAANGSIQLLCMPRILGYGFNPISVYFCHDEAGDLAAILYQVHNTFGERHSYLIPVVGMTDGVVTQRCDKRFYVSPFMDMAMTYDFRVQPPADRVMVGVRGGDADGPLIFTSLEGHRVALSEGAMMRVLVTHPLLTVMVVAAIHWHALKMLLKGFRLTKRPKKPDYPVTLVDTRGSLHDA